MDIREDSLKVLGPAAIIYELSYRVVALALNEESISVGLSVAVGAFAIF